MSAGYESNNSILIWHLIGSCYSLIRVLEGELTQGARKAPNPFWMFDDYSRKEAVKHLLVIRSMEVSVGIGL